ncbi:hypothetical protein BJV74DRAFT_793591 [Russula compacta]|nr:hypothetical protein BJV74DRAFT_793591 [Russula compacta]
MIPCPGASIASTASPHSTLLPQASQLKARKRKQPQRRSPRSLSPTSSPQAVPPDAQIASASVRLQHGDCGGVVIIEEIGNSGARESAMFPRLPHLTAAFSAIKVRIPQGRERANSDARKDPSQQLVADIEVQMLPPSAFVESRASVSAR